MVTTPVSLPAGFSGTGSYLVSESNGYRSRENVIAAIGNGKLPAGLLLGRLTADRTVSGKVQRAGTFVPLVAGGNDGSQTFAGILFEQIDTTGGDVNVTAHVRDMEAQRAMLAFAGTPNDAFKAATYAAMAAAGIALR